MTTWPVLPNRASAPQDTGVHGLGPRRGEHDLPRPGPEERGYLLPGVFERDARRAPFGVEPAGIGVMIPKVGEHRVERRGSERR